MNFELSFLFGMARDNNWVKDASIGDGVRLQDINANGEFDRLVGQMKKDRESDVEALLYHQTTQLRGTPYTTGLPFTHRFYVEVEAPSRNSEDFHSAQQVAMRAIVLSRIIKPLPIPINPPIILSAEGRSEAIINLGFYSSAYITPPLYKQSLTEEDVKIMSELWTASQNFYDNRNKYERIHRALVTFNDAYHIYPAHTKHVILHSAVETLVCTSSKNNRKQFVGRLPQLVTEISEQDAIDIYEFCCGIKHAAEPSLLFSPDLREPDPRDRRRLEAARLLDYSLRSLLRKTMEDHSFAQLLEDKYTLASTYPV